MILFQWKKCRTPVTYMVIPACSAASMLSWSRMDPPGCTTARIPAAVSTSRPSGNGKYASLAATEPAARSPARDTDPAGPRPPG